MSEDSVTKSSTLEAAATTSQSRGWFLVICGFLAEALAIGGRSLFLVVLLVWDSGSDNSVHWTRSELSGLMALVHSCQGLSTPLSGYLIDKFPAHRVIAIAVIFLAACYLLTAFLRHKWEAWFVYGALTGVAFGCINLNVFSSAIVRAMPDHRRGLAVGISTSGGTFGQLVLVPLFSSLQVRFGWRSCFAGLAATTAILSPLSWFLLRLQSVPSSTSPPPTAEHAYIHIDEPEQQKCNGGEIELAPSRAEEAPHLLSEEERHSLHANLTDAALTGTFLNEAWSILREYRFQELAAAFFICGVTTTGFLEAHMVAFVVDQNYSENTGTSAFAVLSACNGFAIVAAGYLTDILNEYYLLASIFFLRGLCYLMLAYAVPRDPVYLWIFSACFGIVDYSVVPPMVALCQKRFPRLVGAAMGILLLLHSIGAAIGSALGGVAYDELGSYHVAILGCAGVCIITGISLYGFADERHALKKNSKRDSGGECKSEPVADDDSTDHAIAVA